MAVYLESWLSEFVAVALVAVTAVYLWFKRRYTYWSRRGVLQADPVVPFGNVRKIFLGQSRMEFITRDIYNKFKGEKYVGMYAFQQPALLLLDPDILRLVMVKDFAYFMDRKTELSGEEPLNQNLFNMKGSKWKRLRAKLTPTFTTGKLKMMCETMQDCSRDLVKVLQEAAHKGQVVEMREVCARFTTDMIASIAFGVECHCQLDPNAEFRRMGRKVFEPDLKARIVHLMNSFIPVLSKVFRLRSGVDEAFDYFQKVVEDTVAYREKHSVVRNDFLHLLIQLKNKGFVDKDSESGREDVDNWKLSLDLVTAQAFLFYIAGFETSSSTMSFALYELAINPEIQRRLQEEVDAKLKESNGQLTYDVIAGMPYLDKVVSETLRKYPPASFMDRTCQRRYQLPDDGPTLEEGTVVFLSFYSLHQDPEYYPDPQRFDPERFSDEEKAKRHPFTYLPFGEGPRNCIGMRLGLLQTKMGLACLMSKFQVHRCEKTQVPLQFSMTTFTLAPSAGLWMRVTERV